MGVPGRALPGASRRNRIGIGRRNLDQRRSASRNRRKAEECRARIAVTVDSQRILLIHLRSDSKSQTVESTLVRRQLLISSLEHTAKIAASKIGGHILSIDSPTDIGRPSHLRLAQSKRMAAANQHRAIAGGQSKAVIFGCNLI